jgi:hypothetical protein
MHAGRHASTFEGHLPPQKLISIHTIFVPSCVPFSFHLILGSDSHVAKFPALIAFNQVSCVGNPAATYTYLTVWLIDGKL